MRIVVISDSHGDAWGVKEIVGAQPGASAVFFLGDGLHEAEAYAAAHPQTPFYLVRGNCDWNSDQPAERMAEVGGVRIFMTHGHMYHVKHSDSQAVERARSAGAKLLLYGHTHRQRADYQDGLYIVNPGSCRGCGGSFAVIDITPAGIVPVLLDRDKIRP